MCGIAAIFAYASAAPSVDEGELTTIRDQMTVRGPDGCGSWLDESRRVGLGHRRLSILDLSDAGAQPMHLPERQLTIVFNGEIYNYRELRAQLERRGRVFHSGSDTEVLLHLYAEKGRAMLDDLRGMYAFALWDGAQRGLFLARDPYGIKPLYVADDGRTLRVASQVKALLAGGNIDTAPEPAGHVGFFLWGHVPEPYTLYRGIRALPAGTTLWLGQDGQRDQRTSCSIPELLRSAAISPLRLDRGEGQGEVSNSNVSVSKFQLSALLKDSVAHHLIADVPVGVFLSSGLDSTTLAALAAEQGGQLRTVTLGFEEYRGTASDETPLAELVARQYGAQHQTVWVQRQDFQNQVENLFTAMDQPSCDGVNTYFVSLAAKRAGLKVALSGLGGDELFGGYPSFEQIPRSVRAFGSLLPAPWIGRGFRLVTAPVLKHFTSPKYAGLLEYGGTYGGAYLLRRGMYMPWELPEVLDADLVREGWRELNTLTALNRTADLCAIDSSLSASTGDLSSLGSGERNSPSAKAQTGPNEGARESHWAGVRCSTPAPGSPLPARLRVSALESCWYMRNQLLRDSDWAGMAHSLEIRVPLVDTTLLRSLLPALGSDTPPTKRDMADAPGSKLPAAVLNRPKTGFAVPVRDWLQSANSESRLLSPAYSPSSARGLRGWAQEVHARFPGSDSVLARKGKSRKLKAGTRGQRAEDGLLTTRSEHLARNSKLPAPRRILVFRIGQLGDTIVALPAMWAVKQQFPEARFTLLCDQHIGKSHVLAANLLRGAGLFERFESYPVDASLRGRLLRPIRMLSLMRKLRQQRFDALVYLAPSVRSAAQITRDRKFFSLTGISCCYGLQGFRDLPAKTPGTPLGATLAEADLLLERLAVDGISVPPAGKGSLNLGLGEPEVTEVTEWLSKSSHDGGRVWIGVGPGSKMPAKRWPVERFQAVLQRLIEQFDVWPVMFGGAEDAALGNDILRGCGRGSNAAGALSLRGAAAVLKRCAMYLGNDTGTMHLAAAAGIPCVAVFSSREWSGMWFPYGVEQKIFRTPIECEGCGLVECIERRNECLNRINVDEVFTACAGILARRLVEKPA